MQRRIPAMILALATVLMSGSAESGIMCDWFSRCIYESLGFQIRVVDKETGQPLADVHGLAEWVQHGFHGSNGPLMVQDAVSGPDGVLTFPAWGPLRGSRAGLLIGRDPVVTLFKPAYKVLLLINADPIGTQETDRVRGFSLGVQSPALEPFRGTTEEWIKEMDKAAYPATLGKVFEDQLQEFRVPYQNRKKRVRAEVEKVPKGRRDVEDLLWSLERSMKLYEGGLKK